MAEIKNKTIIDVSRDSRKYYFECAPDAQLGEIFDVLCEMRGHVIDLIQKANDAKEKQPNVVDEVQNDA